MAASAPAARPSRTAQSVAVAMLLASHDPSTAWLVPPPVVAPIHACLGAMPGLLGWGYRRMERPFILRWLRRRAERSLPGGVLHIATRKAWIEREVRAAIGRGAVQVVIVGAGLDSLAYRLHRTVPQVGWWELDRSPTQRIKRAGLATLGEPSPALRFAAADLSSEGLERALARTGGYDPAAPSVFVAEGLTMYLTGKETRALFTSVRGLLAGGGDLVGTALAPRSDGALEILGAPSWLSWHLRRLGEPFRFGITPEELAGLAQRSGFDATAVVRMPEALASLAGDRPAPTLPDLGEFLFRVSVTPGAPR